MGDVEVEVMGSVVCLSEGGCVESPASGLTLHVQTRSQHIHAYTSEYSNDHLKEKKVLNKSPRQSAIFPPCTHCQITSQ